MPASEAPETAEPDSGRTSFASTGGAALTLVGSAVVLYLARDVFVPLAIAALLSFVLSPPMLWLRHHGLGRAPAAMLVVLLAFLAILGLGSVVVGEVASLTRQLPSDVPNIEAKIQSLREAVPVDRLFQRGAQLMQDLRDEMTLNTGSFPGTGNSANNAPGAAPVPVQIQQQTGFLQILDNYVGPLLKPLALAGLVLVFVIFFLLDRENLRDRFIRLAGAHDLHRTTQMLTDAVERLSRYLWTEFVVNAIYGLLMGVGTFLIGVPNAALWGGMFLVLRFVPYIGTWLAALFPLALSLTIAPGWSAFFETFGLFIFVEVATSQAIEPWLFGASVGMSPVAVVVAATFWTWLWGPIGLVLSTPLTACLVVIGHYVPGLRFFSVLFGNEAPLAVEESFYQRLLAGDAAEAAEQAEGFLKSGPLAAFCDQVAIPALLMAQDDAERGVLTRARRAEIFDTVNEMLEAIGDEPPEPSERAPLVECLGARSELDDAAALLLAQLLGEHGFAARVTPARHWLTEPRLHPAAADERAPDVLCLSHVGETSPSRLRLLARRLRRRARGDTPLVFGLWSGTQHYLEAEPQPPDSVAAIEHSLSGAAERVVDLIPAAALAAPRGRQSAALAAAASGKTR